MWQIYYFTDKGDRLENEDSVAVIKMKNGACLVLADGLGGHGRGADASQTAVEVAKEYFEGKSFESEKIHTWIDESFAKSNERVIAMQTDDCKMKTTMTMVVLAGDGSHTYWAHIGDSRIYRFSDGKNVFCTFDHSVSRMAVLSGEITIDEIRFHPDRNRLLKVIGHESTGAPEYGEYEIPVNETEAFLMCSDGFWEYITESEMELTLGEASSAKDWLEKMVYIIKERAAEKKNNHDNYSAIVAINKK